MAVQVGVLIVAPACRTMPGGSFCLAGTTEIFLVACGCGFAEILPRFSLFCIAKCLIFLTRLRVR